VRGGALGECREPAHVEEQDRDVALLAPQVRALREDAFGQRRIDEGAQRLAQPLPLAEPGDHRVEGRGELPRLVGADDGHAHVEVPGADPAGSVAKVDDRPRHDVGEHQADPGRDTSGDADRDDAGEPDRVEVAGVLREQPGDDDARAPGDHRDRREEASVQ
jgi:hypothetical protein